MTTTNPATKVAEPILRDALKLAMAICDAVPTRLHENRENGQLAHLGKLVNAQPDGAHGYAIIRDALAAAEALRLTEGAQDEPGELSGISGELAALRAENDKLRDALADKVCAATMLHDLSIKAGGLNAVYEGGAALLLAEQFGQQFEGAGANNYLEVGFTTKSGLRLLVTLQRCDGKTPSQLQREAEAKLADVLAAPPARPAPTPTAEVAGGEVIALVVDNANGKWAALVPGAVVSGGDRLYKHPAPKASTEPCQNAAHMGEHACANRHQCWEPCGELGHSAEHAQRAEGERALFEAWYVEHRMDRIVQGINGSAWGLWQAAWQARGQQQAGVPDGWISVEDRLPEIGQQVIVFTPNRKFGDCILFDTWDEQHEDPIGMGGPTICTGVQWNDHEFEDISHWMSLPAAPTAPKATP